jgi:pyrophosphatase PpaX
MQGQMTGIIPMYFIIMSNYNYFLFDADGTLIDTLDLIVSCFENTLKVFSHPPVSPDFIKKYVGLPLRAQMEVYMGKLTDGEYQKMAEVHMAYQIAMHKRHLRLFPGIREGLDMLKRAGRRCAVVTSRRRASLETYLEETGIIDFFDVLITPENTEKHKPDGEPALAAMKAMSAVKGESIFIGDASFDIECASNAGIDSAFVSWSSSDPSEIPVKPTFVINDMRELVSLERQH